MLKAEHDQPMHAHLSNTTLSQQDLTRLQAFIQQQPFPQSSNDSSGNNLVSKYLTAYQLQHLESNAVTQVLGTFKSQNFTIAAHSWIPESPQGTTFILHGYIDHSGLYGHLIQHLLGQGQAVVSFDLPGHGLSTGDKLSIKSFTQYQQVLADCLERCNNFPKPFNAVGQSTGGAILLKTLFNRHSQNLPNPFQQVFLLAPLIRPRRWLYSLIMRTVAKFFIKEVPRQYQVNSHDLYFIDFLKHRDPLQVHTIPLDWVGAMHQWVRDFDKAGHCPWHISVIQGDSDTTVDWRYNIAAIKRKFSNAAVTVIPQARHHLVNESSEYRNQAFRLITFDKDD